MKNSLSILKYEIKENTIEVEVGFKNESEIVELNKAEFENWFWENNSDNPLTNGIFNKYPKLMKIILLEYILKPESK